MVIRLRKRQTVDAEQFDGLHIPTFTTACNGQQAVIALHNGQQVLCLDGGDTAQLARPGDYVAFDGSTLFVIRAEDFTPRWEIV